MTVMAVANPYKTGFEPARIYDRGTGYGIITFDKNERSMKIECWPRNVDPITNPDGQYEGWPLTVSQKDNYGRKALGYLNTLNLEEVENPLVSVYNESTGELEYALPVNTINFQPKVFSDDKFKVEVKDQNKGIMKTFAGLVIQTDIQETIQVNLAE